MFTSWMISITVKTSLAGAAQDGIDVYVDAWFAAGDVRAQLECAFDRAKLRTATLVGERGHIVVEELHRPQRATVYVQGCEPRVLDVPYEVDDFFGEVSHFVSLCEAGECESPRYRSLCLCHDVLRARVAAQAGARGLQHEDKSDTDDACGRE